MSESRILWRRVSRGLLFIGFGAFGLASTQGLLHRGFWLDALAFWPVIIITLGVRLLFDRQRAPWAVLLSPLIIMSTLGFVAWRGPEPQSTDWTRVEATRSARLKTWTLDARVALADLDLRAGSMPPGLLLQGRTTPSTSGAVRVNDRGESSRVSLRGRGRPTGRMQVLPRRQAWDMDVANTLPMTLRLSTAFAEGELDLAGTEVTRVDQEGAFNDLTLRLGAPRSDTRVNLEGAFNQLELVVPESTPVRVSSDGFLNLVDRRANPSSRTGPAYQLRSDGAFNRVVIRSE